MGEHYIAESFDRGTLDGWAQRPPLLSEGVRLMYDLTFCFAACLLAGWCPVPRKMTQMRTSPSTTVGDGGRGLKVTGVRLWDFNTYFFSF